MMNALRLNDGFKLYLFSDRTGLDLTCVLPVMDLGEARGLLLRDHRSVQPTPLGRRLLNDLLTLFLP